MRPSVFQLLLLGFFHGTSGRELSSTASLDSSVCETSGSSSRYPDCKGIQGTGNNADICCAEECLCTCGGTSEENAGKECFITQIRASPPAECDGTQNSTEACALGPETVEGTNPCVVTDGVLSTDDDEMMCCPTGCGTCGGDSCSSLPMSWVQPGESLLLVDESVPEGASSGDYCCLSAMDNLTTVCGVDGGVAPCRMPQVFEEKEDTCGVDGIVGTAHSGGELCCPLGCDTCGSTGCGEQHISYIYPGDLPWSTTAPDTATTADYCCISAFRDVGVCGEDGVEPPCTIPEVEVTLAPQGDLVDTCGVDGIEGIANGDECCPLGCGQCGGTGCGSIDMGYVTPYLEVDPLTATSAEYCCSSAFDTTTPTCGDEGVLPPCYIVPGTPAPVAAATLPLAVISNLTDTCNLPDMAGILDSTGTRCCPQGCGMCGGAGCGSIDMNLITPTVVGDVPDDAKSSAYCCTTGVDARDVTCGTGDGQAYPPCFIPVDEVEDSCYVDGVEGVVDASQQFCCPLGCGLCGGAGCGGVPESQIFTDGRILPDTATASDYCCVSGFTNNNITDICGEAGVEPPCLIPEGTVFPEVSPTPAPTSSQRGGTFTVSPAPSLAPMDAVTCSNVSITMEDFDLFDGIYVMDAMNETLFVRNDSLALLTYVPYEAYSAMNDTDSMSSSAMDSTTNSTVNSTVAPTTADSTTGDSTTTATSECGRWVLAQVVDDSYTLEQFPQVSVQDCAAHPEDIEATTSKWMMQNASETELEGAMTGIVECADRPISVAPATPNPSPDVGEDPTISPSTGGKPSDDATPQPAALGDDKAPAAITEPTRAPVAVAEGPTDPSSSSSSGLSTGQAVGFGVGCAAVAVLGVLGIAA